MSRGPARAPSAAYARGLLTALLFLHASIGAAGSFRISPTLAVVAPSTGVATFTLSNPGPEPLGVQIDAYGWTQNETGETRAPTDDVIVVPRIIRVAPGASQLVRIALQGPRDGERAFRVTFRELPAATPSGFIGIRTTLLVDVPLFFVAGDAAISVDWRITRANDGALQLHASNRSLRYLQLGAVHLTDDRGAVLAAGPSPLYVLAGQRMTWPLATNAQVDAGDTVRLQTTRRGQKQEIQLKVE